MNIRGTMCRPNDGLAGARLFRLLARLLPPSELKTTLNALAEDRDREAIRKKGNGHDRLR